MRDCDEYADSIAHSAAIAGDAAAKFTAALFSGDIETAQLSYYFVDSGVTALLAMIDEYSADCDDHNPALVAGLRDATGGLVATQREARQICREELAPLGFDC